MAGIISVSQISNYINNVFRTDTYLHGVSIEGEVSNFTNSGGNMFFNLIENKDSLSCIVFRSNSHLFNEIIKDGKKIIAKGNITTYSCQSKYQLIIDQVEESGSGKKYEDYLKIINKLKEEGLFDSKYKRPLPKFPTRIGLITSREGAALEDVTKVFKRRYPYLDIYFYPVRVQGLEVVNSVSMALEVLDDMGLDLILITRGGGSFEDLFEFNSEVLARKVFSCKTPIVSAIGHEVDVSIIELVSDLRSSTPTSAAEDIIPNINAIKNELESCRDKLKSNINKIIDANIFLLDHLNKDLIYLSPERLINTEINELSLMKNKLDNSLKTIVKDNFSDLYILKERLEKYNVEGILSLGYAFVSKGERLVSNMEDIDINDMIKVRLKDGSFIAEVRGKETNGD